MTSRFTALGAAALLTAALAVTLGSGTAQAKPLTTWLRNQGTQQCLDLTPGPSGTQLASIQPCRADAPGQQWINQPDHFDPSEGDLFRFVNPPSGLCLQAPDSVDRGGRVFAGSCTGVGTQLWTRRTGPTQDGYQIYGRENYKALRLTAAAQNAVTVDYPLVPAGGEPDYAATRWAWQPMDSGGDPPGCGIVTCPPNS